jgi:hypothetical protein
MTHGERSDFGHGRKLAKLLFGWRTKNFDILAIHSSGSPFWRHWPQLTNSVGLLWGA